MAPIKGKEMQSALYTAYTNAYLQTVDWHSVFPDNVAKFLMWASDQANSRPEFVVTLMMNAISGLLGPSTTVEADNRQKLKPNIYLFGIGLPGTGKSPAYEKFLSEPLLKLEQDNNVSILYKSFTPAGLLSGLAQNSGYGIVVGDEICHALNPLFASWKDDTMDLRHNLNNLFSGGGYSKTYKGGAKKVVKFPSSYFVLGGTSQPDPFAKMMSKITAVKDGLEDRIMILCANPRRQFSALPPAAGGNEVGQNEFWRIYGNWIYSVYSHAYTAHRAEICYTFSQPALAFLKDWRTSACEHFDDQIREFEELLRAKTATLDDVPNCPNDTKDVDYIQKVSVILHVMLQYLVQLQDRGIQAVVPPPSPVIPLETVKSAAHMVSRMRLQMDSLCNAVKVLEESGEGSSAGSAFEALTSESSDLVAMISTFPGKIVASRMLQRKYRSSKNPPKATPILECMQSNSKQLGDSGFFGQHFTHHKAQLFCKAAWEKCDRAFLESHGVTEASYVAGFHADVSQCPATNVGFSTNDDWQAKYNEWIENAPAEIKETWRSEGPVADD